MCITVFLTYVCVYCFSPTEKLLERRTLSFFIYHCHLLKEMNTDLLFETLSRVVLGSSLSNKFLILPTHDFNRHQLTLSTLLNLGLIFLSVKLVQVISHSDHRLQSAINTISDLVYVVPLLVTGSVTRLNRL